MSVAFGDDSTCSDIIEAKMIYIAMSAIKQVDILGVTEVQTDSSNCCKMFNVILNQKHMGGDINIIRDKLKPTAKVAFSWLEMAVEIYIHGDRMRLQWVPRERNMAADEVLKDACKSQETFLFTVVPDRFRRFMFVKWKEIAEALPNEPP